MAMTPARHRVYPSVLYGAGFVAIYFGERILEVGRPSVVATVLGVLLLLASLAARGLEMARAPGHRKAAEASLLWLGVLGLAAVALYFLGSNAFYHLTGQTFAQRAPRLAGVVLALWPALLLAGTLPVLFVELSLAGMKRAPVLDQGRVRAAMLSGLGLSFALAFAFSVAYVAAERDVKLDLSHFRTARAGDATKKLVRALDKPVNVALFFPPANEVREEVDSYFADLTPASKHLVLENFDHALHPAKAKELGVSGNGIVVISRGSVREQIALPLKLEAARSQLRVLDQDVHKRIIGVSRPNRVAYFTQGHEERSFESAGETDKRATVRGLKEMLTDLNIEPRELGMAQGLATDVPADAALVLIIGPRQPFLSEEIAALERYLDRKGRLLIALDPDGGAPLDEILALVALKYHPVTVVNERLHLRTGFGVADRANIATGSYSSHSSVSTIGRFGMRAPVIMFGAGHLVKLEKGPGGIVNVDFTVHADSGTWADANGNFELDEPGEARKAYELAAAVSKRSASAIAPEDEARTAVLADSDAIADQLIGRSVGNAYLARDTIRWLSGEEAFAGTVNTEEDVPITHTRKQDIAWFYISTFVAPLLILAIGLVVTRTRRRRPPRKVPPAAAPRSEGP